MPMATAVWLLKIQPLHSDKLQTSICKVEIQGIADGEVAKGIKAYNNCWSAIKGRD